MSADGSLFARLMANGINWNSDTVRVSLHTNDPQPIDPHMERTRLFLIDADGERHECEPTGRNVFAAPDDADSFFFKRWEVWSETTGSILKGTFEEGQ